MRRIVVARAIPGRTVRNTTIDQIAALSGLLGLLMSAGEAGADPTGRIQMIPLENGLRIYVLERPSSPTVACYSQFQVGSVSDPKGHSGTAQLLERMMFEGTTTVGTTNWKREQRVMAELATLWDELYAHVGANAHPLDETDPLDEADPLDRADPLDKADSARIVHLRSRIDDLTREHKRYIVANEYDEIMSRNGARSISASTGRDWTHYLVELPANMLELWFFMEADRLMRPVFREFFGKRDLLVEERRMRVDNRSEGLAYEAMNRMVYQGHPYEIPVIGREDELMRLRRADAEDHFRTYYSPGNCVMVLVGDLEVDEVRRLAESYLAAWKGQMAPPLEFLREPAQSEERRQTIEFEAEPQLFLGWRVVPAGHPDQYPLDILARILGGMASSRLDQQLVNRDRMAARVRARNRPERHGGDFMIEATPLQHQGKPARRSGDAPSDLEGAILAAVEELRANGVSAEEVERAKVATEVARIRRLDSNSSLACEIGSAIGTTGSPAYRDEYRARIEAVTPARVTEVANRYLGRSQLNVVEIVRSEGAEEQTFGGGVQGGEGGQSVATQGGATQGGEGGQSVATQGGATQGGATQGGATQGGATQGGGTNGSDGARAAGPQTARGERHSLGFAAAMNLASSAAPAEVGVPEIGKDVERVVLPSGITVFLQESHEIPTIRMEMTWLGGSNTTDVDGLAPFELAGALLEEGGTSALTPAELELRMDELGMSFDFEAGATECQATFWSLSRNFEESLALVADMLRTPRLDPDRLEVLAGRYVQAMRERSDHPEHAVSVLAKHVLPGDHPRLGHVVSRKEIELLTRTRVAEAIGRHLGRDNLWITAVGDFERDDLLAAIESRFGSWGVADDSKREWIAREPMVRPGLFVVEKDVSHPAILIVQEIPIDRTAPEKTHAALQIMNDILGGSARSRLMERLRSDEGLTHSVRSELTHEDRVGVPGRLIVSYRTKRDSVARSIEIVMEELETLKYGAISAPELEEHVQAWRNGFMFRHGNPYLAVAALMNAELDDRPHDHLGTRLDAIETLRVGDLMSAARTYLEPANVTITVFGTLTPGDEDALRARFPVTKLSRGAVFTSDYEGGAVPEAKPRE